MAPWLWSAAVPHRRRSVCPSASVYGSSRTGGLVRSCPGRVFTNALMSTPGGVIPRLDVSRCVGGCRFPKNDWSTPTAAPGSLSGRSKAILQSRPLTSQWRSEWRSASAFSSRSAILQSPSLLQRCLAVLKMRPQALDPLRLLQFRRGFTS